MLVKLYGESPEAEKRYSPAECIGIRMARIEGNPDPKQRLDQLRRAPKPHDADEHSALHPTNECLLEKARKSCPVGRTALHALQLLPHSQDAEGYARNGRWRDRSPLGDS